jgi:hypothetical protein
LRGCEGTADDGLSCGRGVTRLDDVADLIDQPGLPPAPGADKDVSPSRVSGRSESRPLCTTPSSARPCRPCRRPPTYDTVSRPPVRSSSALPASSPRSVPSFRRPNTSFRRGQTTYPPVPTMIIAVRTMIPGVPTMIAAVPTMIAAVPTMIQGVPPGYRFPWNGVKRRIPSTEPCSVWTLPCSRRMTSRI